MALATTWLLSYGRTAALAFPLSAISGHSPLREKQTLAWLQNWTLST
jgi:hypothetical protein